MLFLILYDLIAAPPSTCARMCPPGGYSMKRRSLHTCVKPSPDGRYASTCGGGGAPAATSQRLRGQDTLVARPLGESKRHTYAYEYENDRVNHTVRV